MDKLTTAIDRAQNNMRLIVGTALSAGLIFYYGVFMKMVSQRGFTLIEILLVVGIIAFLATMVAVQVIRSGGDANVSIAKAGVKMVAGVASQYFMDTARAPNSMDDLLSNETGVVNWKGPYLTPSQALDPWRNRYLLQSPGQHGELDVMSLGEDGREGGSGRNADVGNWQ
jgi:general secretion pathway protein G